MENNYTLNRFNRLEVACGLALTAFLAYWAGRGRYQNQLERGI